MKKPNFSKRQRRPWWSWSSRPLGLATSIICYSIPGSWKHLTPTCEFWESLGEALSDLIKTPTFPGILLFCCPVQRCVQDAFTSLSIAASLPQMRGPGILASNDRFTVPWDNLIPQPIFNLCKTHFTRDMYWWFIDIGSGCHPGMCDGTR